MVTRDTQTIAARWVFPVAGSPIPNGSITVRGRHILSVNQSGTFPPDTDLGNVALIPGLVNAHTHLDLSGMSGKVPPSDDFVGWLFGVIGHRRSASPEQTHQDIATGLDQALSFGTTLVGDIAGSGESWEHLCSAPVWSVVFRELLGLPEERAEAAVQNGKAWLTAHHPSETTQPGISPHAPYSVRRSVFQKASGFGVPIAVHLAESLAEKELLASHTGSFADFLKKVGVWDPAGLVRDWAEIIDMPYGGNPVLFAHGNYLTPEIAIPDNATVVYCPRTHAAFGHADHPVINLLSRGVRVAIGTDSLASNPDLDVLAEIRFLHVKCPAIPGDVLLRMATINGAEALGRGTETGTLEAGKSADMVAIPLDGREAAPYDLLLSPTSSATKPRKTMWRGVWR